VNDWYKQTFEHLGWMILYEDDHNPLMSYNYGIAGLIKAIEDKIPTVENPDKRADLEIMKNHAQMLSAHVEKTLNNNSSTGMTGGARRRKSKSKSKSRSKKSGSKSKR